jgi:hypothetical protein
MAEDQKQGCEDCERQGCVGCGGYDWEGAQADEGPRELYVMEYWQASRIVTGGGRG